MKISTFILGSMQTNCYFLTDEETGITAIADPADSAEKILVKINERGLKVKYILLTHAHFDHMMALEEIRAETHAPLYIHRLDAPALLDPELSYMGRYGGRDAPCRPADFLLNEGDVLALGKSRLKILHTPGHTMGSVCILAEDSIITGDTLFKGDIGRYDLYGGNYSQLLQSLHRLSALEGDYKIYPGHGSSTRLSTERKTNISLL